MSPRRTAPVKKQQSGLPSWVIVAGVAVVVIVALAVGLDFVSKIQTSPPAPTTVSEGGIVRVGRTEGDPSAPLALLEFSDFQ